MYRVWTLTKKEEGKKVIRDFDGDTCSYSIFDNEEEYEKELARREKIEEDYRRQMAEYLGR